MPNEKAMNTSLKFLTIIIFITLTACSTNEVKQDETTNTAGDKSPAMANEAGHISGLNPAPSIMKGDKKLKLVRIMDGGVCKNEFQGAKGSFLLYVDPNDIERIKGEKGAAIFSAFETKIQDLSGDVLLEAIDQTNLSEDPFALGEDDAQQKLANKLTNNFRNAATDAINTFQKETTLTIDITTFPPSFIFYQKGCEVTQVEPKESDSYGQVDTY